MTEFTKGGWEILTHVDTNTKTLIAGDDCGMVADTYYTFRSVDECEANAHLISAAPDMYEALENLANRIEQGLALGESLDITPARNALKKARGES